MFPKMFKIASVASLTSLAAVGSAFAVDLEFYFPVAVGGAAATTIEKLTADYVAANPGVNIEAIYAGSYSDAGVKALTAGAWRQTTSIVGSFINPNVHPDR
jgi:sn-glycerol 3-phosphate transport system substrate-binding protein